MEDFDDDPAYRPRGRPKEGSDYDAAPPKRLRSSMRGRNDSPPEGLARRRSHSVGFFRDQVSHHDASESRHERPGAEAHVAGTYLRARRDDDEGYTDKYDYDYDYRTRDRSGSRHRGAPQRVSDPRLHARDEYDDDKRTYTEDTMRSYEYEDGQRAAYPPQRGQSRQRHHRHHRNDDRSTYSEYETETRREYYR